MDIVNFDKNNPHIFASFFLDTREEVEKFIKENQKRQPLPKHQDDTPVVRYKTNNRPSKKARVSDEKDNAKAAKVNSLAKFK